LFVIIHYPRIRDSWVEEDFKHYWVMVG
jgi:hypothetical protein